MKVSTGPAQRKKAHKKGQSQIPRTRLGGREAHRWRQVHGDAGGRGRGVSRRQIPALHGAFLPQCFLCCAKIQGQNCGKNAQGDPRAGEQKSVPREGEGCRCRAARHEAEGGRQESRGRH